jgi:hypothetical protein
MTDNNQTPDLLALLKKIEWRGRAVRLGEAYCPDCLAHYGEGHKETCELAAAIEEASKPFDHKQRHIDLHRSLDELIADFITHTGLLPSKTLLIDLMSWSKFQTVEPTEKE